MIYASMVSKRPLIVHVIQRRQSGNSGGRGSCRAIRDAVQKEARREARLPDVKGRESTV